jgi:translation initiation factor IF-3
MTPPAMSGPRFNEYINVPKVRVIDENGENLGVMFTNEAIEQAAEIGLDLVEISPGADPPVAKFLDIGRYKYEAQKKANEQRKKQKTQEIKEIKMRPNIDDHDYDVKMKKVVSFIGEGDKVKITLRFRGRELAHGQLGMALLQRVQEDTAAIAKVEQHPRMEGRQMRGAWLQRHSEARGPSRRWPSTSLRSAIAASAVDLAFCSHELPVS